MENDKYMEDLLGFYEGQYNTSQKRVDIEFEMLVSRMERFLTEWKTHKIHVDKCNDLMDELKGEEEEDDE